jgi:transcriptional regulator with XRE-family HTH domain
VPSNNVQRFREALMMSKAELARKAGLSSLTIDRIEAGRPVADKDKLFGAAAAPSPMPVTMPSIRDGESA